MAEVIRAVVAAVDLEPLRPEPDPVVIRGDHDGAEARHRRVRVAQRAPIRVPVAA